MPVFIDIRGGRRNEISASELQREAKDGLCLAIGNFDGVHLGHRRLIEEASDAAKRFSAAGKQMLPGVWCFSEPPADFLLKEPPAHICTLDEKLSLASEYGAEIAVICDFTELRDMPPLVFVGDYIRNECFCRFIVCGFNFHFGKGGEGDAFLLRKIFGENSAVVDAVVTEDGVPISSSRIRTLIENGKIEEANRLLGHAFRISGEVVHGKALGRRIGLPTVNIDFYKNALVPKKGIYVSESRFDGHAFTSVTNIGVRPTVENCGKVNCETHLTDFDGDLYGKTVEVSLLHRLRDEEKFASVGELKSAIGNDIKNARDYMKKSAEEV